MDEQSWPPITLIHFVKAGPRYSEKNDCWFSSGPALYPPIRIQAKMPSQLVLIVHLSNWQQYHSLSLILHIQISAKPQVVSSVGCTPSHHHHHPHSPLKLIFIVMSVWFGSGRWIIGMNMNPNHFKDIFLKRWIFTCEKTISGNYATVACDGTCLIIHNLN